MQGGRQLPQGSGRHARAAGAPRQHGPRPLRCLCGAGFNVSAIQRRLGPSRASPRHSGSRPAVSRACCCRLPRPIGRALRLPIVLRRHCSPHRHSDRRRAAPPPQGPDTPDDGQPVQQTAGAPRDSAAKPRRSRHSAAVRVWGAAPQTACQPRQPRQPSCGARSAPGAGGAASRSGGVDCAAVLSGLRGAPRTTPCTKPAHVHAWAHCRRRTLSRVK